MNHSYLGNDYYGAVATNIHRTIRTQKVERSRILVNRLQRWLIEEPYTKQDLYAVMHNLMWEFAIVDQEHVIAFNVNGVYTREIGWLQGRSKNLTSVVDMIWKYRITGVYVTPEFYASSHEIMFKQMRQMAHTDF